MAASLEIHALCELPAQFLRAAVTSTAPLPNQPSSQLGLAFEEIPMDIPIMQWALTKYTAYEKLPSHPQQEPDAADAPQCNTNRWPSCCHPHHQNNKPLLHQPLLGMHNFHPCNP